jgi:hypothetical protein
MIEFFCLTPSFYGFLRQISIRSAEGVDLFEIHAWFQFCRNSAARAEMRDLFFEFRNMPLL